MIDQIVKPIIDAFREIIKQFIDAFADAAFGQLKIYLLKPSSIDKTFTSDLESWVLPGAVALAGLFLTINLIKFLIQSLGDYTTRSAGEIITRSLVGVTLALATPFIIFNLFLGLNNTIVKAFLKAGLDVDTLVNMIVKFPATASLPVIAAVLVMSIVFLVLAVQYIIRQAELGVIFILGPYAGISVVNEDVNIFPAWWREALVTVFTQAFQVYFLRVILNLLGNGQDFQAYLWAIGLSVVLLKGPKALRSLLYSSGTGQSIVNAAQGAGRLAILRWAGKRVLAK
ncbi:hypothetical protein H7K13_23850 [Priestia aryabhattai]|uniref:conjugal transfer protein TrbL family protein n=1 Tax=Priestia aryabhattai TaxID=412384 RepID=UPI001C8EC568|nr:conjugal transfer protein TrbL family protein [Priestia aryabhattai]MBY0077964.1 hypothetical protein [Priestia aryabhattai]